MKGLVCKMCGYVALDGSAPDKCPVCGAPASAFEEKEGALKVEEQEGMEKHLPVITVKKECGAFGEGCTDVFVKVGEVEHPMTEEHHITFVDFYLDKKFLERLHFTPNVGPGGMVHVKATSGKVSAVEHCNIHGTWMSEKNL